jgi:protein-tyrosine phosphatase
MINASLNHHLVSERPAPLYMGELPHRYDHVPARVVVNLCDSWPSGSPSGRTLFSMPLFDVLDPELMPERRRLEGFVDAVHTHAAHEPTYWHCHAGLNRSGLAVALYLHRHRGMRISDAIRLLRDRRTPMVLCNGLFERRLREWYGAEDEQDFEARTLDDYLTERDGRRESRF